MALSSAFGHNHIPGYGHVFRTTHLTRFNPNVVELVSGDPKLSRRNAPISFNAQHLLPYQVGRQPRHQTSTLLRCF